MIELNKVMLVGRLTRDPDTRAIPAGVSVTKFSLAVNKRRGRDREDEVAFIDCEAWDKTADFIQQWFTKGKPIFIEGTIKMDRWQDRETGANRSKLLIRADRAQFVGGGDKKDGEEGGGERKKPGDDGYAASRGHSDQTSYDDAPTDDDLPF